MSGGYQYNLTTQSQFQDMKQKNQQLMQQNYSLKKTLEELIKVNNQLSDTIEQFNNSALATSGTFKNIHPGQNNGAMANNHEECKKMIEQLGQRIQYFKGLAQQKMQNEDNTQIFNALDGLIQSFKQTHKVYQHQIMNICQEVQNLRTSWENKIYNIQQSYSEKSKVLQQVIKQLKKKQQIIAIIEKKVMDQQKSPRRILKKNSEIDTSSERKVRNLVTNQISQNHPKQKMEFSNKQIQELKSKQKKLNEQLKEKQKTIAIYTELLGKIRKKLSQRY